MYTKSYFFYFFPPGKAKFHVLNISSPPGKTKFHLLKITSPPAGMVKKQSRCFIMKHRFSFLAFPGEEEFVSA